jgi:hypothetical protein
MGRLRLVACCFPGFTDIQGKRTGCDFLDLGDGVGLSPSLGIRGGLLDVTFTVMNDFVVISWPYT